MHACFGAREWVASTPHFDSVAQRGWYGTSSARRPPLRTSVWIPFSRHPALAWKHTRSQPGTSSSLTYCHFLREGITSRQSGSERKFGGTLPCMAALVRHRATSRPRQRGVFTREEAGERAGNARARGIRLGNRLPAAALVEVARNSSSEEDCVCFSRPYSPHPSRY